MSPTMVKKSVNISADTAATRRAPSLGSRQVHVETARPASMSLTPELIRASTHANTAVTPPVQSSA